MNDQTNSFKEGLLGRLRGYLRLVHLSTQLVAGRRFWIPILLPLLWPAFQAFILLVGWRKTGFEAVDAQSLFMGGPLVVLAIGLGIRIVASEMDSRTLEIAYTVPGGCHRIWLAKMTGCFFILLFSQILLAIVTLAFFTSFPFVSFYGALQAALFYLIAGMAFAAFFRSEISGAMASVTLLTLNGLFSSFGDNQMRVSPFFNPMAIKDGDETELFAWTLQNRIFFLLLIAVIVLLTFARVERREKMLGD
jgi:hypothetical protein